MIYAVRNPLTLYITVRSSLCKHKSWVCTHQISPYLPLTFRGRGTGSVSVTSTYKENILADSTVQPVASTEAPFTPRQNANFFLIYQLIYKYFAKELDSKLPVNCIGLCSLRGRTWHWLLILAWIFFLSLLALLLFWERTAFLLKDLPMSLIHQNTLRHI